MKLPLYILLVYISISASRRSLYNLKSNAISLLRHDKPSGKQQLMKRIGNEVKIRKFGQSIEEEESHFRLDPVLNLIDVRRSNDDARRNEKKSRKKEKKSSSTSTSSSNELPDWKDEWREHWLMKKFEAINSTDHPGDNVNIAAARPWGNPCGDPDQHDMPWGTCTLPVECDAEYRIYRGDYACGRTQFICCALILSAYDTYQGFDVSFEDSALKTDSNEKNAGKSAEDSAKSKKRLRRKRIQARKKRKKVIKRLIDKIQKEIRKILNRQNRNATRQRKRRTKQLKDFIKMLKEQYKKDRKTVQDIHEHDMMVIDDALKARLEQISLMNQNFVNNATFREVVVNGTINRVAARMLVEAYPELESYINLSVRRSNRAGASAHDYLDYDVEYGMLYY